MRVINSLILKSAMLMALSGAIAVASTDPHTTLLELRSSWTEATLSTSTDAQKNLLKNTVSLANEATSAYSDEPEVLGWAGIIEASYAGSIKGMSALKHAKRARTLLAQAMEYDPEALEGGARSTLGVLYYKVPGWPIGFGNKKRAELLLEESANKYPSNLNAQFFYGEFLFDQKRRSEALTVFTLAQSIPVRPTYRAIDSSRLEKIEEYLAALE